MARHSNLSFNIELAKASNKPVHLVQADFATDSIYLCDYVKSLSYGGHTFSAAGHLLTFTDIEETAELDIAKVTISLSGVDSAYIAIFLGVEFIDRPITIYRGFISGGDIVGTACPIFAGRMDAPLITDSPGDTTTVSVQATNYLIDFEAKAGRHTNYQEQRLYFPEDEGLYYASEIHRTVVWSPD